MTLLTVKEAAAKLRVSVMTMRRHLANGNIPVHHFKIGGGIRIEADDLERWMRSDHWENSK